MFLALFLGLWSVLIHSFWDAKGVLGLIFLASKGRGPLVLVMFASEGVLRLFVYSEEFLGLSFLLMDVNIHERSGQSNGTRSLTRFWLIYSNLNETIFSYLHY